MDCHQEWVTKQSGYWYFPNTWTYPVTSGTVFGGGAGQDSVGQTYTGLQQQTTLTTTNCKHGA